MAIEIAFGQQTISVALYDPNTLAARGFAEAAAASAAEAQSLLADTTLAIGGYENTSPTITNGYFDVAGSSAGFVANDLWRSYRLEGGTPGEWYAPTMVVNSGIMAAAAFVDDDNLIIGDVFGEGPGSGASYFERLLVQWPVGATALIGSAPTVATTVDGVSRRGGPLVEKVIIDQARAQDVAAILADQPWTLKAWAPAQGYYNTNGAFSNTAGWNQQVFEIAAMQAMRPENVETNGSVTQAITWGAGYNAGTGAFATVLGGEGAGFDGVSAPLAPTVRIAPPGTTHVAITTYGDRDVQVWISDTPATAHARELSDLISILNPCRGKTILADGDSLFQGGGVTGSVPAQFCAKLNAKLINRAIGGSSPTNGYYYLREGPDTIGLSGLDYTSVRVLRGASLAELADRRTNWASFWRDRIPNAPSSISDDEYAVWTAASYENSLVPYLDDADFMVTNHAHNAAPACPSATGWTTFTGALTGTGIGDGVLTISSVTGSVAFPQRIFTGSAFDESGDTGLFIGAQLTGTSGGAGTYQVLGTWPGTISSTAMTGRPYNFAWNDTLLTIPGPGGTTGHTSADPMDRGYYVGAQRFMFNLWYSAQSGEGWRRPLIIAGHDRYDQKPNVCLAQELMHTLTRHPILRVWEHTAYSKETLTEAPYAGKTIKQAAYTTTDPLHDYEDATGRVTRQLGNIHASLLLQAATGA